MCAINSLDEAKEGQLRLSLKWKDELLSAGDLLFPVVQQTRAYRGTTRVQRRSTYPAHRRTSCTHRRGTIAPTETAHMPTGANDLFQEIKTESLGTQNMPPKIDTEAPGFIQTDATCERFEKYSEPKTFLAICICYEYQNKFEHLIIHSHVVYTACRVGGDTSLRRGQEDVQDGDTVCLLSGRGYSTKVLKEG
uniref:Uncharacterized protein n=1 Tax=Magallana gigas TaxID=29159 RepID=A0A8W8LMS9_MAGGI